MSKTALPQMPQYSQDMIVKAEEAANNPNQAACWLMFRYYGAWNPDGSREPVSYQQLYWPDVFTTDLDGNVTKIEPLFVVSQVSDDKPALFSNNATVAYYPLYYTNGSAPTTDLTLTVQGAFEQTGYMSASLWRSAIRDSVQISEEKAHFRGDELTVVGGDLNPFIKGNPSVFAYERPAPLAQQGACLTDTSELIKMLQRQRDNALVHFKNKGKLNVGAGADEHIDFYRPTTQSFYNGEYGDQESLAPDGCSADYLATLFLQDSTKPYFILKMKVPTTFIHDDDPETTYAGYQIQEFTIDTYTEINGYGGNTRYGLTSRQVNDYKDADGYAYVFLAPPDFVTQLAKEQGLDYSVTKIPPVYIWNGNTGYVLDRGIVNIRHRGSDPTWEGYVGNSTCYLTDAEMEPIQPEDLGEYYPELTGVDSL